MPVIGEGYRGALVVVDHSASALLAGAENSLWPFRPRQTDTFCRMSMAVAGSESWAVHVEFHWCTFRDLSCLLMAQSVGIFGEMGLY